MRIVTDIKEANNLLHSYGDAKFQIAFYSEQLKRIAIRIYQPDAAEIIYLIGVGCESMNGHFSLSRINLSIIATIDGATNERITSISDHTSGFELITSGGFSVAQGNESEFGNSFDNFIKKAH